MREALRRDLRVVLLGVFACLLLMGTPACSGCSDSGTSPLEEPDAGGDAHVEPGEDAGGGDDVADAMGGEPDAVDDDTGEPPEDEAWLPPGGVRSHGAAAEVESPGYRGRFFFGALQVVGDAESRDHVARFGPGASHVPPSTLVEQAP